LQSVIWIAYEKPFNRASGRNLTEEFKKNGNRSGAGRDSYGYPAVFLKSLFRAIQRKKRAVTAIMAADWQAVDVIPAQVNHPRDNPAPAPAGSTA